MMERIEGNRVSYAKMIYLFIFIFLGSFCLVYAGTWSDPTTKGKLNLSGTLSGDGATATDSQDLDLGPSGSNQLTLECWIKPTTSSYSGQKNLIVKGAAYKLYLDFASSGLTASVVLATKRGGVTDTLTSTQTVTLTNTGASDSGGWTHICVEFDGSSGNGTATFYVDGNQLGTTVSGSTGGTSNFDNVGAKLAIGSTPFGDLQFTGFIDEVRISNNIAHGGNFNPNQRWTAGANTMALYHFDGNVSSGGTTADSASSGGPTVADTITLGSTSATLIDLAYFKAIPKAKKIILKWKTDSETYNAGFNILRSTRRNGGYLLINDELIESKANGAIGGAKYHYIDDDVKVGKKYFYKLVDIDIAGKKTNHGPIKAKIKDKSKRKKKHHK